MPVHPVTGESLPNPGMRNGLGITPVGGQNGLPGVPQFDPSSMGQVDTGGQQVRLSQLLEAREMIDQEIAAIIGVPPGTENMDMLPPPPMDPMMPPQGPPNGMPGGPPMPSGPPMGQPMPPMGPQGLLGM